MQTENNTPALPLYKVLDEKRTQSKWEVTSFKEGDFGLCMEDAGDSISEGMKSDDAQYTALAVNNLSILAEALQPFIKLADAVLADTLKTSESPLYGYNDAVLYVKDLVAAKEALQRIS